MAFVRSPIRVVAAVVVVLMAVAGCAGSESSGKDVAATTHVVSSEFGDVVLPVSPKAALGMYTTDVDILITLGIPLAKDQPIRGDGYTSFPSFFPQDALKDIKPFANYPDFNYEAILAAQPDFILNGLGYDEKVVKRLPEITATYSLNAFDGRSWREHFEETAEALGRTEQYQAWVAKYEKRVAEVKAAIGDKAKDITVAPIAWYEGKIAATCYTNVECAVFDDLGLSVLPVAKQNDGEGVELSAEQLGQLADLDYGFSIKSPGTEGQQQYDKALTEAAKNPLWAKLDFVKQGRLFPYDLEMTFGSPSGQMAFLDVVEKALVDG